MRGLVVFHLLNVNIYGVVESAAKSICYHVYKKTNILNVFGKNVGLKCELIQGAFINILTKELKMLFSNFKEILKTLFQEF
jgi:hypothetical protein